MNTAMISLFKRRMFSFSLCYGVISFLVHADPSIPFHRLLHTPFSTEQGLPENTVLSIVTTPDGYLWLASQGLTRFDGRTFTQYHSAINPEIPSNQIISMYVGRDSSIWAGTYGGGVWNYKNGIVTVFTERDGLCNNIVRSITQDSSGRVWLATTSGVDALLDGKVIHHFDNHNGLPVSNIWCLFVDRKNALWIGTYGGGVTRYAEEKFTTYSTAEGMRSNMIMSINESRDGTIWVGTDGAGVCSISDGKVRFYDGHPVLTHAVIWTIFKDQNADLWFGTHGGGLLRWNEREFEEYTEGKGSLEFITTMAQDFEGNYWIGTQGRGLHRLKRGKFTAFTKENGLPGNNIRTLLSDRSGAVWVGTVGSGVAKIMNGSVTVFNTSNGLSNNFVWSIMEDSKNNVWIGTGGAGLNKITDGKITRYSMKEGLSNNFILTTLEDSQGDIWIGTNGGGVNILSGGTIRHISTKEGLSNDFVVSFFEHADGSMWIATSGGGMNILKEGKITILTKDQGLHTNYTGKIFLDRDGVLWLFGGGGITRFEQGRIVSFHTSTDLFSYGIYGVAEDSLRNFWFSTSKGIYAVQRSDVLELMEQKILRIPRSKYDRNDGMPSSEFGVGSPSVSTALDGTLWFPSTYGIVIIDPYNIPHNRIPPPVYIEQVIVDKQKTSEIDRQQLSSLNRSYEFHFTAVSYYAPDNIQFRFILEGFNNEWIDAGDRRTAYYTNIPHGNYTFRVTARNSDGVWNEAGASVSITILPQFYETTPFFISLVLVVTFIVAGAMRYREGRLKRREVELLNLVEERTRNLREEKERTEAALKQTESAKNELFISEQRYRNLVENINEAYFVLDAKGNITYSSPNFSNEAGYTPEELTGRSFITLIAPEDRRRMLRELSRFMKSGKDDLSMEFKGLHRNGSTEWVEQNLRVVRNEDRSVKEYHNVLRKISDRKNAEEALRISEERYRKFFMYDLTGDFSATPDGVILQVNTSFLRIFGFASENYAKHSNIADLYSSPRQWPEIIRVLATKNKIEYNEAELKNLQGETIHVIQNIVGLYDSDGNLTEVNGYIFDNTAMKRLEEQLLEAQKMESIGTLAGGIAHDFNNILAIILGFTQMLYRDKHNPEKITKRATAIMNASERASDLVRQLLTFARKGEMIFEPVNINNIVREVASIAGETFPKTIRVKLQLARALPEISAFSSHIHQALLNLCLNARDAMPEGGELRISTSVINGGELQQLYGEATAGKYVLLEIADTGVGMDLDIKTRIYEPFFTTKERGRGTGLGLAVVYGIIQNHRGIIDCESKKDQGTTFRLYLPIEVQTVIEKEKEQMESVLSSHGTETILLVEDEAMLVQLLKEHLENKGYTVLIAMDGIEAIEVFQQEKESISLIITDLGLPKLGGWDSYKKMKELRTNVPAIIVSGFLEDHIKEEIKLHSDIIFMSKPYSPERLLQQVRFLLDKVEKS